LRCGIFTANFSASRRPAAVASAAFLCEFAANASWAAREISYFAANPVPYEEGKIRQQINLHGVRWG
jgi:hypothetical protein